MSLASPIGKRPLIVPSPLGVVEGVSDKASSWERASGQKSWARDTIFNLILGFSLLDGIPSVLGGLAGQWHSWISHSLPQPQLRGEPSGHRRLRHPKQPERDLGCLLLPGEGWVA